MDDETLAVKMDKFFYILTFARMKACKARAHQNYNQHCFFLISSEQYRVNDLKINLGNQGVSFAVHTENNNEPCHFLATALYY